MNNAQDFYDASNATVIEVRDDPPFHKCAIGTFEVGGRLRYFSVGFNPRNEATIAAIPEPFQTAVRNALPRTEEQP